MDPASSTTPPPAHPEVPPDAKTVPILPGVHALEGGEAVESTHDGCLAHIPLFSTLAAEDQQALHGLMKREELGPQQCVFWLGDVGDSFYVINKGEVAVTVPNEKGEHVIVSALSKGAFFGEISLLDGGPRTATIRTTIDTELYKLSRKEFHAFLRRRPEAALAVLTVMGRRHRASTEALRGVNNANAVFDATRITRWQRISDIVARVSASQYFTAFHLTWFGSWIILNLLGAAHVVPNWIAFDPFPFGLLTMIVSLEAIFLAIFVMVSQNRQSEKDRLRTDLDYQVNVKAQTEIMSIARRLDRIEEAITAKTDTQRRD